VIGLHAIFEHFGCLFLQADGFWDHPGFFTRLLGLWLSPKAREMLGICGPSATALTVVFFMQLVLHATQSC
jgi:hypothetical protein